MEGFSLELSKWVFPKFFFFGLLIFVGFRLLRFMLDHNPTFARWKRMADRYLPLIEFLVWLVFLFWVVSSSFETNILLAIAVMVLLLYISYWVSQYVLKGFIAGVVFRFTGSLRLNETVTINGQSGRITQFKGQTLEIETEKGEILFVPYSEVMTAVQAKNDNSETIRNHSFQVRARKEKSIEQLKQDIRASILQLPWASVKRAPNIAPLDEEEKAFVFKITVYSVEKEYFHRIEKYVKEKFEDA